MTRTFYSETNVRTQLANALDLLCLLLTNGYNTKPKNKAVREAVDEALTILYINQVFNDNNPDKIAIVESCHDR